MQLGWVSRLHCWIEHNPGTAAWVQAGGSILALIVAIIVPRAIARNERRDRTELERINREDRLKRERLLWRHYGIALRPALDEIRANLVERLAVVEAGQIPERIELSTTVMHSLENEINNRDDIGYKIQDLGVAISDYNKNAEQASEVVASFMADRGADIRPALDNQRSFMSRSKDRLRAMNGILDELDAKLTDMTRAKKD